jgi:Ca-activated chloride channel family protein
MGRLRRLGLLSLFLACLSPLFFAPSLSAAKPNRAERKQQKEAIQKLPEKYRLWLDEVGVLITDEEITAFLALEKDYQRDAFIKRFWDERDQYKATARNEFHDRFQANAAMAKETFGSLTDERAHVLLLNGPPAVRIESRCFSILVPIEVWYYAGSQRSRGEFFLVFYRQWGAGNFRIWSPMEGIDVLFSDSAASTGEKSLPAVARGCMDGDKLAAGISWVGQQGLDFEYLTDRLLTTPKPQAQEWVASFNSYSTDVPEGAPQLPAQLEVTFPGRYQNRTVLQGLLTVPTATAGQAKLGDQTAFNLLVNGEVLQNGVLFDSFRYKFDFPVEGPGGVGKAEKILPMAFQRYLRPDEYKLIVRVEDINSGKLFRDERAIVIPAMDTLAPLPPANDVDAASARLLAEVNAALARGETTVKILPPTGELQTGMLRFDTLTTGANIAGVTFSLDGKPILTKKKPPFSVELDLGPLPRAHKLAVMAFDGAGSRLAEDTLPLNAGGQRFKVRLIEPQRGKKYTGSLLAKAEVDVPDGETLERVEFFLNETKVATAYQPPYAQPVVLPKGDAIAYVRAIAHLTDGNTTEQVVFVNAPENLEELEVSFVELYTSVFDRQGRPVSDLELKSFAVAEDGVKQEIVRFDRVHDLPIHAAVALDVSASMSKDLDKARQAALRFLQETVQPKDRAAIITFNDHPNLGVKFTNDVQALAGGLTGLKAERGTALYDSIVFCLYYFNGIKGQRAVLLLSDGKDEGSRFTFDDALDYARRAGVTIYAIGLGGGTDKRTLSKLSEETGGRPFFIDSVDQLPAIYKAIEEELRSQYLLGYQSTNTSGPGGAASFRSVEVKVDRSGLEAKTIRGYYP